MTATKTLYRVMVGEDFVAFEEGNPWYNGEWYRTDEASATVLDHGDAIRFRNQVDRDLNGSREARSVNIVPVRIVS